MIHRSVPFSMTLKESLPRFHGHVVIICPRRIVPFFIRSSSEHTATLAVIGELYACKCHCARMALFGNGNFCTERGKGFPMALVSG